MGEVRRDVLLLGAGDDGAESADEPAVVSSVRLHLDQLDHGTPLLENDRVNRVDRALVKQRMLVARPMIFVVDANDLRTANGPTGDTQWTTLPSSSAGA